MIDQERRQEVLKAEEAIRALATEIAHASGVVAQVDAVKSRLEAASTALEKAKYSLDEASRAISETETASVKNMAAASDGALLGLAESRDRLEQVVVEVPKALEGFTQKVAQEVESRITRLRGLVIWAVVLAAASILVAVVSLVLSKLR